MKYNYNNIKKSINSINTILKSPINRLYSDNNDNNYNNVPYYNDSKIREIMHYININKTPLQKYEFLILLTDDYFKKRMGIFPSKKFHIKKTLFPGTLNIQKYSDLTYNNNNNYTFESNPIPNQIYIKLNKEDYYVLYSEYEQKLLESQFSELYDILSVIGAKYIKVSKVIRDSEISEIENDNNIGLCTNKCKVSNKLSMKNENDTSLLLTQEMKFNNDKDPVLDKLIDNNYYYLPNQVDLQQLIIRRIESNQTTDKYIYNYYSLNLLSNKIIVDLKKLHIGLNYSFKKISNFYIEYEIHFNNIKNSNINSDDNDETSWLQNIVNSFINKFYR